jgi:hypothetical protein
MTDSADDPKERQALLPEGVVPPRKQTALKALVHLLAHITARDWVSKKQITDSSSETEEPSK